MPKLLHLLLFLPCLVLVILTGCNGRSSEKEAAFQAMIHITDVNTSITMKPIPNIENTLEVRNQTSYSISLPKGFGLKLYIWEENQKVWVEIGNDIEYIYKANNVVIPPKDDEGLLSSLPIGYKPDIGNHQPPATIRAFLSGKIIQNGVESDQEAAAFTDVRFVK